MPVRGPIPCRGSAETSATWVLEAAVGTVAGMCSVAWARGSATPTSMDATDRIPGDPRPAAVEREASS
jgi:hypothetical protein